MNPLYCSRLLEVSFLKLATEGILKGYKLNQGPVRTTSEVQGVMSYVRDVNVYKRDLIASRKKGH